MKATKVEDITNKLKEVNPDYTIEMTPEVSKDFAKMGLGGEYKTKWYEPTLWKFQRWARLPEETWDNIVAFYQRGRYGYAVRDCWGIDDHLAEILPKMLRTMIDDKKGGGNSFPGHDDDPNTSSEQWPKTIEKMAKGFDAHKKIAEEWIPLNTTKPESKKIIKEYNDGMALFVKYFGHLWD